MELDDVFLGSDENCVLQYLNTWPDEFVSEKQIARRADSKDRFMTEPHWTYNALSQLLMMELIETDGTGKYRMKVHRNETGGSKKFMAPHLRQILEKSGKNFDLSAFAP